MRPIGGRRAASQHGGRDVGATRGRWADPEGDQAPCCDRVARAAASRRVPRRPPRGAAFATQAAVLAVGEGALLSHFAAAAVWELCAARPGPIDVTVPGRNARNRPGIRVHRVTHLHPADITRRRDLPSPAQPAHSSTSPPDSRPETSPAPPRRPRYSGGSPRIPSMSSSRRYPNHRGTAALQKRDPDQPGPHEVRGRVPPARTDPRSPPARAAVRTVKVAATRSISSGPPSGSSSRSTASPSTRPAPPSNGTASGTPTCRRRLPRRPNHLAAARHRARSRDRDPRRRALEDHRRGGVRRGRSGYRVRAWW